MQGDWQDVPYSSLQGSELRNLSSKVRKVSSKSRKVRWEVRKINSELVLTGRVEDSRPSRSGGRSVKTRMNNIDMM